MELANEPTELCNLGYKYGTDKCPQIKHSYTPYYYKLLNSRKQSVKKFLELGIGRTRNNTHIPEKIYEDGVAKYLQRGASLRMWRDFFPNALVYGADIHPDTMFIEERIKTYLCDERKKQDLTKLVEQIGTDIDVVLDDASHHTHDQIFAALTILPLIDKGATYIIEDATHTKQIRWALNKQANYEYFVPRIYRTWKGGMVLVINK